MSKIEVKDTTKVDPLAATRGVSEKILGGLRVYAGHFRYGNRPPMVKQFFHVGDKISAIERFKKHCEIMNYKFCGTYPAIVDLDAQEALRNDELDFDTR